MSSPVQKSRLGRGLASLIGEPQAGTARLRAEGEQKMVAIAQVRAGKLNPRKIFRENELDDLATSIRTKGLVQPILVRPDPEGAGYEIVAGERRWRASQRAGLHHIPVIVRELADKDVLEIAIIENVQRADLNAIEEAGGYRDLIERFSYSQEQVAEIIGKSRSHIANTLRLLKLPPKVQEFLENGQLTAGHARALIGNVDAEALAERIVRSGMNVREVEQLVQEPKPIGQAGSTTTRTRDTRDADPDTRAFERELTAVLGLKVEIKRGSGESGTLTIKYGNFDQLDFVRALLVAAPSE